MSTTQRARQRSDNDELTQFIDSIPAPQEIRNRISRNAHENSVLKRILKLSEAAETHRQESHRAS